MVAYGARGLKGAEERGGDAAGFDGVGGVVEEGAEGDFDLRSERAVGVLAVEGDKRSDLGGEEPLVDVDEVECGGDEGRGVLVCGEVAEEELVVFG